MKHQNTIRTISLFLNGLYAGAAMYSLMGIGPAMKLMPQVCYVEFHQKLDFFMGVRMAMFAKITLVINVLLLIAAIRHSTKPVLLLTIAAFLFFTAELFFTLTVNVPINTEIQKWGAQNLPGNWMLIREKWVHYDVIRAVCIITSFALYLVIITLTVKKTEWAGN